MRRQQTKNQHFKPNYKRIFITIFIITLTILAIIFFKNKSSYLIATKQSISSNISYNETMKISFKHKTANKIIWTLTFDNTDTATTFYKQFSSSKINGFDVSQNDKKITITITSTAFENFKKIIGSNTDYTKQSLKTLLESKDYTIK